MAMLNTARSIMAIAVKHQLPLYAADVPMAFIQSDIPQAVWIDLPAGVEYDLLNHLKEKHPESKVAIRLIKSLYGLKQSPALWNAKVDKFMEQHGFERCTSDSCLYKSVSSEGWTLASVSVDDILITGSDPDAISKLRLALDANFGSCKWHENCSSFLGMDIQYNQLAGTLILSCPGRINAMFEKYDKLQVINPSSCPYSPSFKKLDDTQEFKMTDLQAYLRDHFASIVGTIIYMSSTCRPDITTLCNKACKGMHNPQHSHLVYLEHLLKYLKGTIHDGLCYKRKGSVIADVSQQLADTYVELKRLPEQPVIAFSDANFAESADVLLRSTSGWAIYVFNCLVSWSSKRQTLTARSTFQAELISASSTADEASWFHSLTSELDHIFYPKTEVIPPIAVLIDNVNALNASNHPTQTPASKHIKLREFRIREAIKDGMIRALWVPTPLNVADFFTKPMGPSFFLRFKGMLGFNHSVRETDTLPDESYFSIPYSQTGTLCTWDDQLNRNHWSWYCDSSDIVSDLDSDPDHLSCAMVSCPIDKFFLESG